MSNKIKLPRKKFVVKAGFKNECEKNEGKQLCLMTRSSSTRISESRKKARLLQNKTILQNDPALLSFYLLRPCVSVTVSGFRVISGKCTVKTDTQNTNISVYFWYRYRYRKLFWLVSVSTEITENVPN